MTGRSFTQRVAPVIALVIAGAVLHGQEDGIVEELRVALEAVYGAAGGASALEIELPGPCGAVSAALEHGWGAQFGATPTRTDGTRLTWERRDAPLENDEAVRVVCAFVPAGDACGPEVSWLQRVEEIPLVWVDWVALPGRLLGVLRHTAPASGVWVRAQSAFLAKAVSLERLTFDGAAPAWYDVEPGLIALAPGGTIEIDVPTPAASGAALVRAEVWRQPPAAGERADLRIVSQALVEDGRAGDTLCTFEPVNFSGQPRESIVLDLWGLGPEAIGETLDAWGGPVRLMNAGDAPASGAVLQWRDREAIWEPAQTRRLGCTLQAGAFPTRALLSWCRPVAAGIPRVRWESTPGNVKAVAELAPEAAAGVIIDRAYALLDAPVTLERLHEEALREDGVAWRVVKSDPVVLAPGASHTLNVPARAAHQAIVVRMRVHSLRGRFTAEWFGEALLAMPGDAPDPVRLLSAAAEPCGAVRIAWVNAEGYDALEIARGTEFWRSLEGPRAAGMSETVVDTPQTGGPHVYCVTALRGGLRSAVACVQADVPVCAVAPLVQLQCASTACGELTVAWTADAAHTHVDLTLNDATPVRLPAGAAPYTLAVTGGVHVVAAQGVDAQGRASAPRFCEHRVQTCVLAGVAVAPASCGAVSLSWAPGRDDGTFVEVAVDGTPVALFPGAPETGGAFTLGTLAAGTREICVRPMENGVEGDAVCALVDVAACAGPGIGPVRCSLPGNGQVLLEWECDAILDSVRVERNGVLIAVLSGSARSFADAPPEPGTVRYRVIGEAAGADGPPGTCAVRVGSAALAPVRALACAAEGCGRVRLTWEAGAVYDDIRVLRNGELVAVCAGDAAGYHDAPLAEGVHEYGVVAFAGAQISTPVWCETRVEPCSGPAAPSRLVCTPSGCEAADLAWQPQDAYDRIEIMRDGLVVAVLAADADAWHDAEAGAGMHQWCVTGFRGVTGSVPACAWLALDACAPLRAFIRGDANGDGEVEIGDAITMLGYLFAGNPEPQCLDAADANDDASLDIGDAIAILGLLFGDAGALPPPYPSCGFDPTVPGEALGCVSYPHCDP